ncbi:MAG: glutamine--fructose-6-phosphate transaminase (isomerizing) [Nanoarchaeota archaeon]
MCGIVGYLGDKEASSILFESLKRLEYRGYDSFGFATVDNNKLWTTKDKGKISEVGQINLPGSIGISHTRWATHGPPSKINAHPHTDCKNRIALVHNGIIVNYLSLRNMLKERCHVFKSETDTEVLAHLIEEHYKPETKLEDAVAKALEQIEGAYAIVVVSESEKKLVGVKNESPLVLGVSNPGMYLGSDISSFLPYTNETISLNDFEMAVIEPGSYTIMDYRTGLLKEREIKKIEWNQKESSKEGFDHFMLKEIFEQPTILKRALSISEEEISQLADVIKDAENVYITATGTSLHAAMTSEYWFSKLAKLPVRVVDSSEFEDKAIINDKTLVIGITQSGETYDTLKAMRYAISKKAKTASIVNVPDSTATQISDITILQGSDLEVGVAATKTFTTQLMVLLRLVLSLSKKNGNNVSSPTMKDERCLSFSDIRDEISDIEEQVKELPKLIEECLTQKDKIKTVAEKYCANVRNLLYIGKGINYPTAMEGALKLKEISYLHAEGMPAGFLKHGTISLIADDMYTVAFVPRDDRKILSNVEEIKSRGGKVIGIVSGTAKHFDDIISVPKVHDIISPIVFAPAYQLLAYYTSVALGKDPDKPRHLAKSVTVE